MIIIITMVIMFIFAMLEMVGVDVRPTVAAVTDLIAGLLD